MKIKGQRKAKEKRIGPPVPPTRKKVILETETKNTHIKHINTIFSISKSRLERQKKLEFSLSFFKRKIKNLEKILNAIVNGIEAKKIFETHEDFNFHEFKRLSAKEYSVKVTREINSLKEAKKYTLNILKQLE